MLYISSAGSAGGPCQPPHAKISIVEVPLDAPETASVFSTPALTVPGFGSFQGCHDITVYLAIHKAAAACQSEGQIWDITDPANPGTANPVHVDTTLGGNVNYWHSSSFTWDGQYILWNDESFTGRCNPTQDGRMRVYRIADNTFTASFMIPRSQGSAYCSIHNGNIIPVADRYLLVAAWYAGGTSIVDFTNPAAPVEVGYYDASVGGATDTWSSYWYNDAIYANDINRGFDVFQMTLPSSAPYGIQWDHLNPQTQENDFLPATADGDLDPGRPAAHAAARGARSRALAGSGPPGP